MAQQAVSPSLSTELPPPARLAAAYAPARARPAWIAFLALDQRLARAALGASEPVLAQLRLAWWRERFQEAAARWPAGEPLLAELRGWDGERAALERLVDGWELVIGGAPAPDDLAALAEARAGAVLALARLLGCGADDGATAAMARCWASSDLARRFGYALMETGGPDARLPRAMRPLAILTDLAIRPPEGGAGGLRALARIVRLGLLGR